ncbi:response regulator [Paenibacillus harenae]|uniref:response regulator n=1 Tax=Paenibacillus harenae TaxID=306543 RepID=UPI000688FCBC|nr:response regulator [Paenibacillus harenae]
MVYYLIFAAAAGLFAAVSLVLFRKRQRKKRAVRPRQEAESPPAAPMPSPAVQSFSARSAAAADQLRIWQAAERSYGLHAGILVVDDQPSIRMLLTELFNALGADVYPAEHGAAALKHMIQHTIDCVLLDLKMPDMDGIEVLKEIRKISQDIPVILVSAYAEPAELKEAARLGVNYVLRKPLDIDELRVVVLELLEKRFEIMT